MSSNHNCLKCGEDLSTHVKDGMSNFPWDEIVCPVCNSMNHTDWDYEGDGCFYSPYWWIVGVSEYSD